MAQPNPDLDTTEHTSQTLLKSARDAYRSVFDQSPLPMLACDIGSLEVLAANELAATLHASTPEALVGVSLFQLRRVSDLTSVMLERAAGREVSVGFGYHVRSDGSLVPVQMWVRPGEFDGRPAWLCVLKSLEGALQQNEGETKRRMFELVGRISLGAAHDLNNLLSVILSFTGLLSSQLDESATVQSDLKEIREAAERATALTRQITSLARRTPVAPKPIQLNEVVTRLEPLLRRLLDEPIGLTTCLDPTLHLVMAEGPQLERLLLHLVTSAGDAASAGDSISIETKNVQLDTPAGAAQYVMLSISDTTLGPPREPGVRGSDPFAAGSAGPASGLAEVSAIVQQLGGAFWVESEAGKGARFVACLPRLVSVSRGPATGGKAETAGQAGGAGKAESVGKAEAVAARRKAKGETVLVVEDNPHLRQTLKNYFARDGYHVLDADSSREALRLAEGAERIDLLLTDLALPDGRGIDLADAIRERLPGLKVLFASARQNEQLGVQEDALTVCITRPFDLRRFGELVGRLLDQP